MQIVITGANSQLATDLLRTNPGHELIPFTRQHLNVCDRDNIRDALLDYTPQWIINCAAFNRTEECESDQSPAFEVNAIGPLSLAIAARQENARLLHISTDYVFDGKKGEPYTEEDETSPINTYGLSKLMGESSALAFNGVVVRTASLYGIDGSSSKGGNFVNTIMDKALSGTLSPVVDDVIMSPTYSRDLAQEIWKLIDGNVSGGIYHRTNDGACSWHEFATEICRLIGRSGPPRMSSKELNSRMTRPPNSALTSAHFPPLRHWKEALSAYMLEKHTSA